MIVSVVTCPCIEFETNIAMVSVDGLTGIKNCISMMMVFD